MRPVAAARIGVAAAQGVLHVRVVRETTAWVMVPAWRRNSRINRVRVLQECVCLPM